MRKINENDYVNFTIAGNGWSCTVASFAGALKQYNDVGRGCTLYGNKPDGTRAIIDAQ